MVYYEDLFLRRVSLCVPQHSHPGSLFLARQHVRSDQRMELTLTLLVVRQCCNEKNQCFCDAIYIQETNSNRSYIQNKQYPCT